MTKNISQEQLASVVEAAYLKFKDDDSGSNANYIPFLADVPSELFGIALTFPSGDIISFGDVGYKFGIESISKVSTALLAMEQHGAANILEKIGADATGLPFNSVLAVLMENNHPTTPLVNAGAISACSMVEPMGDGGMKWDAILSFMSSLTASSLEVEQELFKSESDTNYNNRAISWLLKNYERIYDDVNLSLSLYTRQCSVGVTARELSVMAATIACGGVNPLTGVRVFREELAPKIVTMMAAVGFYEHTGRWMFESGLPAKSGVGGGIMGVMPGVFGVAAFSPRLDGSGNSVRAQKALQHIMKELDMGIYNH